MESNNFEKEMNRKLGEFRLVPDEEVWTRIAKQVAPKRGTRKGVLLFVLLLLISIGGGWWLIHQNPGSKPPSTFENAVKRENKNKANGTASPQIQKNEKTINAGVSQAAKPGANTSSAKAESTRMKQAKEISKKSNQFVLAKTINRFLTKSAEDVAAANELPNQPLNEVGIAGGLITVPSYEDLSTSKHLSPETLNASQKLKLTLKKETIVKHKWKTGFTLSGGSAGIEGKGAPALYANNVQTGSFNTAYVYYPLRSSYAYYQSRPSSFQTSSSFTAGVFAERAFSSKTSLSVGISYLHLSVKNNVRNNFEFIQLPVLFHLQLNRDDRLPLTIDAGLTAAQMAAANAQQYNYLSNSWYHDNDLFKKFQANIHAGFSLAVFNRNGKEIRLGPGFYYGLIPMADQGIFEGKHLHVLNIHMEMLLDKK